MSAPADELRAAATKLADPACGLPKTLADSLRDLVEESATRWATEMVRDRAECPSCDSSTGCGHPEQDFHDGSNDRAGCERPVDGPDGTRCDCFDRALAVARAVNGGQQS
jgi:hypothetical protein